MELNRETIPQYLRERQVDIGFFDSDVDLHSEEIGDGNLNFVFRVSDKTQSERSLVLKQAPPYIKILGPDYPLPIERLTYESRSLQVYNQFASETVPTLYYFDSDSAVIAMEDLKDYNLLRDELIAGNINQTIPVLIGRFMGIVHSQTCSDNLDRSLIDKYQRNFANTVMQSITADYVFTFPFTQHETNFWTHGLELDVERLKTDNVFLEQARNLKAVFLTKQSGLTHGDLHTGSIMARGDSAKVIDSEFAFYGPVGFDIGLFWANYFLSYFSHTDNSNAQSQLKNAIRETWETYTTEFQMVDTSHKTHILQQIIQESIGFAGMEMLRRIIGAAHVKDIERISNLQRKLRIETDIIEFGGTLVKQHKKIGTIDQLIDLL